MIWLNKARGEGFLILSFYDRVRWPPRADFSVVLSIVPGRFCRSWNPPFAPSPPPSTFLQMSTKKLQGLRIRPGAIEFAHHTCNSCVGWVRRFVKTYLGIASFFGEFPTHLVPGRWDLVEVRHSNTRWRCRYMTIPMRYYTLIGSDITQMVFLCRCLRADAAVVNTWAWSHINGAMVLGCIVPRHRLYVRKCIRAEFWINMKIVAWFRIHLW